MDGIENKWLSLDRTSRTTDLMNEITHTHTHQRPKGGSPLGPWFAANKVLVESSNSRVWPTNSGSDWTGLKECTSMWHLNLSISSSLHSNHNYFLCVQASAMNAFTERPSDSLLCSAHLYYLLSLSSLCARTDRNSLETGEPTHPPLFQKEPKVVQCVDDDRMLISPESGFLDCSVHGSWPKSPTCTGLLTFSWIMAEGEPHTWTHF